MDDLYNVYEAVDPDFINQLLDIIPEKEVLKLLSTCLADAQNRITQIRSAKLPQDLNEVEWNAHDLKGSAGQLGATRLSDLAHEISHYCKSLATPEDADIDYVESRRKEIINLFTDVSDTMHNKYLCRADSLNERQAG